MDDFEQFFEEVRAVEKDDVCSVLIIGSPGVGKTYKLNELFTQEKKESFDTIFLNCFEIQTNFEENVFEKFLEKGFFLKRSTWMYKLNSFLGIFWKYFLVPYLGIIGALVGATFADKWKLGLMITDIVLAGISCMVLVLILINIFCVSLSNFLSKNILEIRDKYFSNLEKDLIIVFDDLDRVQEDTRKREISLNISLLRDKLNHFWNKEWRCFLVAVTNKSETMQSKLNENQNKNLSNELILLNETIADSVYNKNEISNYRYNYEDRRNGQGDNKEKKKDNLFDLYNKSFNYIYEAAVSLKLVKKKISDNIIEQINEQKISNVRTVSVGVKEFFDEQINDSCLEIIGDNFDYRKIESVFFEFKNLLNVWFKRKWIRSVFQDIYLFEYIALDYSILKIYDSSYFYNQDHSLSLEPFDLAENSESTTSLFKSGIFYTSKIQAIYYSIFSQFIIPNRALENLGWDVKIFNQLETFFYENRTVDFSSLINFLMKFKFNNIFLHFLYKFLCFNLDKIVFNFPLEVTEFTTYNSNENYIVPFFLFFVIQNAFGDNHKINSILDLFKITDYKIFDSFCWNKKKLIFKVLIGEYKFYSRLNFYPNPLWSDKYDTDNLTQNWRNNPFFQVNKFEWNIPTFPINSIFIRNDEKFDVPCFSFFNGSRPNKTSDYILGREFDSSSIIDSISKEEKFDDKTLLASELIDIFSLNRFSGYYYNPGDFWYDKETTLPLFLDLIVKLDSQNLFQQIDKKIKFKRLLNWFKNLYKVDNLPNDEKEIYSEMIDNLNTIIRKMEKEK